MTFDRSAFFPGTPVPLPIKLTPRYNWNSVESGVKHYNPNLARFIVCKLLSVMNIQQYNISCNTAVNQTRHLNSFSHYLIHVSIIQCYKDYFISTKTASSASFLDIYLELDTKDNLSIRFYDKGEETTSILPLQSFPQLDSNIHTAPAYGIYISPLTRYASSCSFNIHNLYNKNVEWVRMTHFWNNLHSRCITGFVTRLTRQVPTVE